MKKPNASVNKKGIMSFLKRKQEQESDKAITEIMEETVESPLPSGDPSEEDFVTTEVGYREKKRMEEAHKINTDYKIVTPEDLEPAYIDGEPYAIIEGEYKPWHEAIVIAQENKIKIEKIKLAHLKSNPYSYA